jgi:predicted Zn-dependent protease
MSSSANARSLTIVGRVYAALGTLDAARGGAHSGGVRNGAGARLVLAAVVAIGSLIAYWASSDENPITGETQHVAMSERDEVAMGLQAEPEMVQQFGGLDRDPAARARVDRVGNRLLAALNRTLAAQGRENPYPFRFHLLADPQTVNAFALPGGQVFVTQALFARLETDGQLAGVLGHEIGHVLSRHGAQQMAKAQLNQGLAGAAGVAGGTYDSQRIAQQVAALATLRYGRQHELEADRWGVRLAASAGYDPRAMLGVLRILDSLSQGGQPEFLSTHPKPANRLAYVQDVLSTEFPNGLPEGLEP